MKILKIVAFFLIIVYFYSCDSPTQPNNTAFLDIVVAANDSVKIELDNKIIVNKKLVYFSGLGFSWFKRYESIDEGIHKIKVTVFDRSLQSERRFYVKDTLSIHISLFPESDNKIYFSTVNHEFYGE